MGQDAPRAAFDLAGSNLLGCTLDDLPEARDALELVGSNDDGYVPLVEAIARRYGVDAGCVALATGSVRCELPRVRRPDRAGDHVLVERPGYDPLMAAAAMMGASVGRFERAIRGWLRAGSRCRPGRHHAGHPSDRCHELPQSQRRHRGACCAGRGGTPRRGGGRARAG